MGKKGGAAKIEVTRYYMGLHFGICTGPVDAMTRIIVKEKTAWEGEATAQTKFVIDKDQLFGGREKEGGVEAVVYWLPGGPTQVLDDHLAQRLGRANGADTPGYRGVASAFFVGAKGTGFPNFAGSTSARYGAYWSANSPYLPGVWITVRRAPVGLDAAIAMIPRGAEVITTTFSEAFTAGLTPYSVYTGSLASFTIETDTYGNCLQVAPGANDIDAAVRPIPSTAFSAVRVKFKVTATDDDDYGVLDLRDSDDNIIFNFTPGRQDIIDALRRPSIAFIDQPGSPGNPIGAGSVSLNTWYQLVAEYDDATSDFTATITDLSSMGVFGSVTVPVTSRSPISKIIFRTENANGSGTTRWDDLEIDLESGGLDANPAHIIYECLTNTDWGMGSPATAIDTDSFEAVAATLYAELFGLSLLWTRQASIQDFIQEILDHIQAVLYVDPATGLLTLTLIRGDYDVDTLPEINPDNADLTAFSRKLWGEITNEIIVTWTNPENEQEETVTVQDLASIATQGGIISDSRNYYAVRKGSLAAQLANRDLRSSGQPLASFELEVDRTFWDARPAMCAKVTWPEYGLDGVVARATSVDYGKPGDPTIKLQMVEDVFGLDFGDYIEPPSSGWEDPSEPPEPLTTERIFTLPLFFALNSTSAAFVADPTYPQVLAGILATTTQEDAYGYDLWDEVTLSNGTLEWQNLGTKNIIGHAELVDALVAEAESVDVSFASLIVDTSPVVAGFVIIGDGEESENEIAQIDAIDETYDLIVLRRGVLDTVPQEWPAGTPVWFVDEETLFEDDTVRAAGETMSVKLLTRTSQGTLDLADAALVSHDLTERPWLPNRPANVQVEGVLFNTVDTPVDLTGRADPWVTISWTNRNRLLEDSQVLGWTDATVTPETGQTTKIEVYASDGTTLLADNPGLSGTAYDVLDADFGTEGKVLLKAVGERSDSDGDFESLQSHGLWVRVRGADEFAQDVANLAFFGNAGGPAGFHDSTDDMTWAFRETWDGSQRQLTCTLFDKATGEYSAPYTITSDCLTNDAHGLPSGVMDHEGYAYVAGCSHNSAMKLFVTARPRDPTEWIQLPDIGTDLTYAHLVRMGTALYLFARGNSAQELHRYKTTALSGGVPTWGAAKVVAAFTGDRFYLGQALANGTDIHLIATYADSGDTLRRDIYEIIYDSTDESVGNSDGSVSTAVGSQPISKATADASYIIVNQTTNETDVPGFCITPDGKRHLAYIDGTASPWPIAYQNYPVGGPWSAPATIASTTGSTNPFGYKEEISLAPFADNSIELWFPDDPGALFDFGGDMMKMARTAGGSWGPATTVKTAVANGYARPTPILNADPGLYMMFTETVATELDADAGGLKAFGYGSGGLVPAHAPVFTSLPVISNIDGFLAEDDVLDVASGAHNGTSSAYQWKRNGAAIVGETGATYTLDAADVGAMITVTQTASNFVGDTSSTSVAVGPIGTPTFATQNRTLSDTTDRTLDDLSTRTMSNRTA